MGRLYVISDIHGYGHLLRNLLICANYDPAVDRLYMLGDYVNKGPDSVGTLDLIAELCDSGAVALQGNNERKWLARVPDHASLDLSGALKYQQFISRMPLWAEHDSYVFVHAGVRPEIPLRAQKPEDLTEIREPFLQSGRIAGKIVVFGHTSTFRLGVAPEQLWHKEGKLGIDTGAGHGYYLSLVDLTLDLQWLVSVKRPDRITCRKFAFFEKRGLDTAGYHGKSG